MIRDADAIFVFDDESRRRLARAYPEAREKTFPLGWLTTVGPIEIRDPYGGAGGRLRAHLRRDPARARCRGVRSRARRDRVERA
jgi:hypothetical protein